MQHDLSSRVVRRYLEATTSLEARNHLWFAAKDSKPYLKGQWKPVPSRGSDWCWEALDPTIGRVELRADKRSTDSPGKLRIPSRTSNTWNASLHAESAGDLPVFHLSVKGEEYDKLAAKEAAFAAKLAKKFGVSLND